MPSFPPQVADFKALFRREFIYGVGLDFVTDNDIQRGLNEATVMFNTALWDSATVIGDTTEANMAFLYLAAHLMVMTLQQMAGGLSAVPRGKGARNSPEGIPVAAGVGTARVTYQVPPQRIADNAVLLDLYRTTFGQRYLAMIEPRLIANVYIVSGVMTDAQQMGMG